MYMGKHHHHCLGFVFAVFWNTGNDYISFKRPGCLLRQPTIVIATTDKMTILWVGWVHPWFHLLKKLSVLNYEGTISRSAYQKKYWYVVSSRYYNIIWLLYLKMHSGLKGKDKIIWLLWITFSHCINWRTFTFFELTAIQNSSGDQLMKITIPLNVAIAFDEISLFTDIGTFF